MTDFQEILNLWKPSDWNNDIIEILKLALNTRNIDEDVLVVAGDMLFDENALDITQGLSDIIYK